jgi:hypothetical protein
MLASQQKESRLLGTVTLDMAAAEYKYFDKLGSLAQTPQKIGRGVDTVWNSIEHERRRVEPIDYIDHLPLDESDKLRIAVSLESGYVQSLASALNRRIDQTIVNAALGTAYTGKTGSTPVTFDTSNQQVAVNYVEGSTPADSNLTLGKLRSARQILLENEAIMDNELVYCVISPSNLMALLRNEETTSVDYNTVKSLVNGQLDTFMGFKFIVSNLLPLAAGNVRSAIAYSKSALAFTWLKPVTGKVAERSDKNYTLQMSIMASFGASRLFEDKIVEILCDEDL